MKKLLTIFVLLTLSQCCVGQGITLPINHIYFYQKSSDGDSVKCKRTPKSELRKLGELPTTKDYDRYIGISLRSRITNVEFILDTLKAGEYKYFKTFPEASNC